EPQETLWEWFFSSLGLWKKLLDLWDGVASEADTFLSVQKGGFGDQALHASSTSISLKSCSIGVLFDWKIESKSNRNRIECVTVKNDETKKMILKRRRRTHLVDSAGTQNLLSVVFLDLLDLLSLLWDELSQSV